MRAIFIIIALTLLIGGPGTVDAQPPGSCQPWPECKEGDDGSGDGGSGGASSFFENCKDLGQWTVTAKWSTSKGECSAKNTDAVHFMDTATDIDLSNVLEAQLSYKYRIENADIGEFMRVFVSSDGGGSYEMLKEYVGSESGTVILNLAEYLTNQVRLRASCFVSANNEICGWDNIKIETVMNSPGEMVVTINSPQARTYGVSDFPLTYDVSLSQMGTADYTLNDGDSFLMTPDEGYESGTEHTTVEDSLSNDSYTFEVTATNESGSIHVTQSVDFIVDTLAPTIEFVDPTPPSGSAQNSPDISVKLSTNSGSEHYAFVDFDSDLYLWMRMEEIEEDVVFDSSSYQNDGVAEGDAFQNSNGKFGSAFEFDGINHGGGIATDRIVIPDFQVSYQIFDTSFTAMAWARPDVNEKMVIIGNKSITNLPGWHLRTSGGNHRLRMGVNSGYTNDTAAYAESHDPMVAGEWVHVVGTYDHTIPSIQLYLDGELIDTTTAGVSFDGYGNDLDLALAVPEDPQKAWDGLIDEVLIFNRVLDANEVRALYDSTANQFQNDYQGLDSGLHEFVGFSVNALGNEDQTEFRNVTIN